METEAGGLPSGQAFRARGCHLQNSTDTSIRSLHTEARKSLNILKGQCRVQRGEDTNGPKHPGVLDRSPVLGLPEHLIFPLNHMGIWGPTSHLVLVCGQALS